MSENTGIRRHLVLLVIILICCFYIYYPASLGGFIYDDSPNIAANSLIQINSLSLDELIIAATSGESGPLGRPVSMMSFALNYYFTGLDPFYFKLVNIGIHLINGVLIYILTAKLLQVGRRRGGRKPSTTLIPLAVTALWLFHPVNLSSVAYVVQRMNELAALFTLAGLGLFLYGRERLEAGQGGRLLILLAFVFCGVLALLSKENGALVFIFFGLIELMFFRMSALGKPDRIFLGGLYLLFIVIPVLTIIIVLSVRPEIFLSGYIQRDFTLLQRLLTEARVLWFYIYLIFIPDIRQLSMYHDDIVLSQGLLSPLTTLFSIIGIISLLVVAFMLRDRAKIASFGVFFFLLGHSIESGILPLNIAFEHRNYLPSYGLLLMAGYYLLDPSFSVKTVTIRKVFLLALILVLGVSTHIKARQWQNTDLLRFYELEHNPESAQVNYDVGRFYASALDTDNVLDREQVYRKADFHFRRAIKLDPDNIEALTGLVILASSNGYPVDVSVVRTLENVLQDKVISATGSRAINALLQCRVDNECTIEKSRIDSLLNNIAANHRFTGRRMELLYLDICRYYARQNNIDAAYRFAKAGLSRKEDSVALRIMLAGLLVNMGRTEEARNELGDIKNAKDADKYKKDIRELEVMLGES